jgi:hypothetical protein
VLEFREGSPVRAVQYGVVPSGYRQNVPTDGAPPLLREEQTYEVYCGAGIGRFRLVRSDLVAPNQVTPQYVVVNLGND